MGLKITPLTEVFGAEVTGTDLRSPLDRPVIDEILSALARHLVLVFPAQPMDDAQQIEFSKIFGPLEITGGANPAKGSYFARQSNIDIETGATIAADDRRMLYQKANMLWHSDSSFKAIPSRCSVLTAREIPADIVYEDDLVVAFPDIAPKAPVHLLVVPKTPAYRDVVELAAGDPALLAHVVGVARELAATRTGGDFRLLFNTGAGAGQTIFHVHAHVLGSAPGGALTEESIG